jgi:RNA polymerase sigma-70 factor (ECF subfamily)
MWILRRGSGVVARCCGSSGLGHGAEPAAALVALPSPAADAADSLALRQLLDRLPPQQREAFVLTQLIGLSYEEAAAVCSCPIGTIRSRVARAREELLGGWQSDSAAFS